MKPTKATAPGSKSDENISTMQGLPGACSRPEAGIAPGVTGACANTHDGKLVSISGDKLVMTSHEGQEYSHTLAPDAKICCDGKTCRPEDLKIGSKIRLTTDTDDKHVAASIESLHDQAEFAPMN